MKREDRDQLAQPYSADGTDVSYRLARRLGAYVDEVIKLEAEIVVDLDEVSFGVGWWAPHPGTSRRILISDYLWQCCHSIQQNLMEAALHLVEARGAWADEAARQASGLRESPRGDVSYEPPFIATPLDELPAELHWLHVAGVMRSIGSTLDCIGGVAVGVAGLKRDILTADLDLVFGLTKTLTATDVGTQFQARLVADIAAALDAAGPPGWWRWASHYRNMLVHRGRRTRKGGGHVVESPIVNAVGQPVPRLRSFPLLPRDPSRSDVEVMLHLGDADHLTEDGLVTLAGILASTTAAVKSCASLLRTAWQQRRASPLLVLQPREQWRNVKTSAAPFVGYAPGTVGTGFRQVHVAPVAVRRLRAAALTSDLMDKWKKFD
jgi:hypothetical protein